MIFPIYVNTLHLLIDNDHFRTIFSIPFIYIGFLSTLSYFYLGIFILNPKCKEKDEEWKKYTRSSHFIMFNGFYNGLILKIWEKRNAIIFISIKRLIIGTMASLIN